MEVGSIGCYNRCIILETNSDTEYVLGCVEEDGLSYLADTWELVIEKPEKIIPGTPLDPTLPILHAGYIQDRQRKRFRDKQ
jgi:hypothetical protein